MNKLMNLKWWNLELTHLSKMSESFIANDDWLIDHVEHIKQKLEKE